MLDIIIIMIILFGAIMGLEIYFVISALLESRDHTAVSAVLLLMASVVAYFGVLIYGVASYSKELNQKTGYMTFMTPISSFTNGNHVPSAFCKAYPFSVIVKETN